MSRKPISDDGRALLRRLGTSIREARRECGWKQENLGARAGVAGSRVGEIERGRVDTSITRVAALAAALRLTPSQLLRQVEIAAQDARATERERARVADAIRRVDPRDLDALAQLVHLMTAR